MEQIDKTAENVRQKNGFLRPKFLDFRQYIYISLYVTVILEYDDSKILLGP